MKDDVGILLSSVVSVFRPEFLYTLLIVLAMSLSILLAACTGPTVAQMFTNTTRGQAPLSVTFTNESTNADKFQWDFGDGATTTTTDVKEQVTHEYIKAGTHTVTLTAIKGTETSETSIMTLNITVEPGPLDKVTIENATVVAESAKQHQFIASALDRFDNPI